MEEKTIGQVAQAAEIKPSTLRYYESIGLLHPIKRVNGQRRYDQGAETRLAIIQIAKLAGFTLKEIGTLLSGFSESEPPSAQWKILAGKKLQEVEALISRAQGMKKILQEGLHCECLRLEECAVFINP